MTNKDDKRGEWSKTLFTIEFTKTDVVFWLAILVIALLKQ